MPKHIQIDEDLFFDMVKYFIDEQEDLGSSITYRLEEKLRKIGLRMLYSEAKNPNNSEQERMACYLRYLEQINK